MLEITPTAFPLILPAQVRRTRNRITYIGLAVMEITYAGPAFFTQKRFRVCVGTALGRNNALGNRQRNRVAASAGGCSSEVSTLRGEINRLKTVQRFVAPVKMRTRKLRLYDEQLHQYSDRQRQLAPPPRKPA